MIEGEYAYKSLSSRINRSILSVCPGIVTGDQDEPKKKNLKENKSPKKIDNAMKAEDIGDNTEKPIALDPRVEIYRGRSPRPYVPITLWRTWWKLFYKFLVLREITEEKNQRFISVQEVGKPNYELLVSVTSAGSRVVGCGTQAFARGHGTPSSAEEAILAERFGLMSKLSQWFSWRTAPSGGEEAVVGKGGFDSEGDVGTSVKRVGENATHLREGP
ncbi:unnamed protein product [Haemonchus placei]|uniref:DRBM domain-containing protein n=1 Tax=Haemonchus placei TaxID=6290 RepID=A0A0N4WT01_HAEPC|nr:unnamed protein product [Haemonchus placei]